MGNKRNQISVPWAHVIVLLYLIEALGSFVDAENGFTQISKENTAVANRGNINVSEEKDEGKLHIGKSSVSSKIDEISKLQKHMDENEKLVIIPKTVSTDSFVYNSVETPSSLMETEEEGMEINDNLKKWLERVGNSNSNNNLNVNDYRVITQAFRFVKLDSHLAFLISQLTNLQSIHESMQNKIMQQDIKVSSLLDKVHSLVNSVAGDVSNMKTVEDKIETEIQTMNRRLDNAVEKIIQSSTTSAVMFELSKESLLKMENIEMASKQVSNEVQAVKTELRDVGQSSLQTIYNMNKLEENLMAGLERAGNRTVYALRQDAKVVGPSVLLAEEEGNSVQADVDHSRGSLSSSVRKLSLVDGGTINDESLGPCLSRRLKVKRPRDCGEIQLMGHSRSGVYTIFPSIKSDNPAEVYCDLETDGGGWTVIQRRTDSRENFYRSWKEYQKGFGSPHKQHWLGLETIAEISQFGDQELKVELVDWSEERRDANYAYFRVANASDKYRLHLADYVSGSSGDSLSYHNGMQFSTKDQDNDLDQMVNCAEKYQGAWWYKNCHFSNLNGAYLGGGSRGRLQSYGTGLNWYSWHGYYYSIQRTEMKMRSRFLPASLSPK
ncbi:fibrinogen C domain-containing protein 1 [Folsomia candida]|uniref:fibrinogen C domain-containing protein 1 n=1 Tax=Folsomia candida TaxID=158441 RepID=UPI000B903534|nr:fibrinogen C domain-containing protein 1 [Folsomia candida]